MKYCNEKKWVKDIAIFLTSQTISQFGSSIVEFAIIWHITLTTNSGMLMAAGVLCVFIPRLIISLFAGVWADRNDRKKMIIWADLSTAFITLILAFAFFFNYESIFVICLALVFRSIGSSIQAPCVNAVIPMLTPPENLLRINGINGSLQALVMLLSPITSGWLLSILSLKYIFFIDIITALIAVCLFVLTKLPNISTLKNRTIQTYSKDLLYGIQYFKNSPYIRVTLIICGLFCFLSVPATYLTPLMVARVFGDDVWLLTINEISISSGLLLGGVLLSIKKKKINLMALISLSCILLGISLILLPFFSFSIYLILMANIGIQLSFFQSTSLVLLQKTTSPDIQGRVMSFYQIICSMAIPLGMIFWGPLGDNINIRYVFIITGVLFMALSIMAFYKKNV